MPKQETKKTFTVSVETLLSHSKAVEHYLRDRGDYDQLLEALGAKIEALEGFNPQQRIPVATIAQNIDTVAQWIEEPNLGLKVAPYSTRLQNRLAFFFQEDHMPLLDYFRILARYVCICSEVMRLEVHTNTDSICLHIFPNCPESVSIHQIEGFTASLCDILQSARNLTPAKIEFTHSSPENSSQSLYKTVLGTTPTFNQPITKIQYPNQNRDCFTTETRPSEASFVHIQSMEAVKHREIDTESWQTRCNFLLEILMLYGEPNKSILAELLAVTPRTLQRHLEREGTTFREMLNALRQRLAAEHITNQQLSCEDIAFMLGYQDAAHFFRAFKRWYGTPPGQYRNTLK